MHKITRLPDLKFTLRTKLIAFSIFLVTLTMVDLTYFFTIGELRDKREGVEQLMTRLAENIATVKLIERQNWSDYQSYISQLMPINDDIVYIAIYDDRNWLRANTLNTGIVEIKHSGEITDRVRADFVRQLDQGHIARESRKDLRVVKVNIQAGDRVLGSVHVGFSMIELNDELQSKIQRNIGFACIFIVVFSVLSFFLSKKLTGPLERLSKAMKAIADGNLEQKVDVENRDEIGELAQTFNEMVDGLRDRDRMKGELEAARNVHTKLLPDHMPSLSGYQIDGVCLPAQEVGGDYFDFFKLNENQLGIVIADVSGKGTSASFYMAEIKGMMLSMVSVYASPKELLGKLNRRLYRSLDKNIFVTMIYGILDTSTHKFLWSRAGHDCLLHLSNGSCELIKPAGIGLGLDAGEKFDGSLEEFELQISRGDFLLMFTDGITEARNAEKEEFGESRLMDLLKKDNIISAQSLRDMIFSEVDHFQTGSEQHDDLTMVVVHCEGKALSQTGNKKS